jgi:hypothetical protein
VTPRYRIKFSGMPNPRMVRWLQALIPVLREAPRDVEVSIEIETDHSGRDPAA